MKKEKKEKEKEWCCVVCFWVRVRVNIVREKVGSYFLDFRLMSELSRHGLLFHYLLSNLFKAVYRLVLSIKTMIFMRNVWRQVWDLPIFHKKITSRGIYMYSTWGHSMPITMCSFYCSLKSMWFWWLVGSYVNTLAKYGTNHNAFFLPRHKNHFAFLLVSLLYDFAFMCIPFIYESNTKCNLFREVFLSLSLFLF